MLKKVLFRIQFVIALQGLKSCCRHGWLLSLFSLFFLLVHIHYRVGHTNYIGFSTLGSLLGVGNVLCIGSVTKKKILWLQI